MNVKCVICDTVEDLNDENPLAKKLRNRPIHTFMCTNCHDRIAKNTISRLNMRNEKLLKAKIDKVELL